MEFQAQFKLVTQLVETIESVTRTMTINGGPGLPLEQFQRIIRTVRLTPLGARILGDMLTQSDTITLDPDRRHLVLRGKRVIDVEVN